MKRTLLTILAIFYLGVSSGATVHFHYCMGELVSWGLEKQSRTICDFCGMPKSASKKKSCCKDVEQQVKVAKSQKVNQVIYKFDQLPSLSVLPELFVSYQAPVPVKITGTAWSNAPPDEQQIPVYLKNCTYRI
ncbi:HYC_CC_PP family protein [Pedobacter heparinus]|uniref:HYC_CC_PP family protein n=1 Tax=Pedobacter heparinus TaxID=984 RepID=UPI00292E1912|nr:hypothetical protein [Pedobacter heparinus]